MEGRKFILRRGCYSRGSYPIGNDHKWEEIFLFKVTCFKCGEEVNRTFESKKVGSGSKNAFLQEESLDSMKKMEGGENLMINRSLWDEGTNEDPLRRGLFKTRCKFVGKCCKMIIDNGKS